MKIKKYKLTRETFESFAGKQVKIVFFDNTVREGVLVLGISVGEWFVLQKPKMYSIGNFSFRFSHIKSIEVKE